MRAASCAASGSAATRPRRSAARRWSRLGGPRLGEDRLARHALLQQQLGRLDPRVGVEPRHEDIVMEDVGERDERHALMMREERAHDFGLSVAGGRSASRCRLPRPIVDRLVEAESAVEARRVERVASSTRPPPGSTRPASAVAYGATTRSSARPRLKPKARHAERLVLIVARAIRERVRRLRDAPRHAPLPAVFDLPAHARAAALVEQRAGIAAHQQQRHQVLEHRAAPRHQRGAAIDVGHQAAEVEPVVLRDVALGDRDEAGQPRFRGQQVVERAVERARVPRRRRADSRSRRFAAGGRRESRTACPSAKRRGAVGQTDESRS